MLRFWYVVVIVQTLIPSPSAKVQNPQMIVMHSQWLFESLVLFLHSVQVYSFGSDLL